MADSTGKALLLAVTRAVKTATDDNPVYQSGGGQRSWFPIVAQVLSYITGQPHDRKSLKDRYRKLVEGRTPAAIEAMIASVDPGVYRDVVRHVLETGIAPASPPPVVPGVNVPAHEPEEAETSDQPKKGKKRKPTAEELDALTPEEILGLSELDARLEQSEAKARFYKRLYDAAKQRAAFVRTACEMLSDIVHTLESVKWDKDSIPTVHIRREQEAILLLSDIHIGDEIKADTMGALNVYNFEIFQQKLRRLYAGVRESLEMFREYGPVRKLRIFGLGDWTTGVNIFPGQAHHIEFGAMHQAMKGADELSRFHQELLELPGIEIIEEECIPGNHGRPGRKGNDPFEDNWDIVMYEFLRLRLAAEKRINLNWHYSWWMMPNVLGWNFLCAHGDEVKGNLGIPNYGLRRWGSRWRELLDSVGKRYDYGVIGHHHVEVEEKNLIISGAWPGASFFSAKELQSGGEATQMLYSVSQDYGITWRRRLPLDPPRRTVDPVA